MATMDALPGDILIRILARLPRRDLFEAIAVSKLWRDVICSVNLHSFRQHLGPPLTPFLLVFDQVTEDPDPPIAESPNLAQPAVRMSFFHLGTARWRQIAPSRPGQVHPGRRSGFSCVAVGSKVLLMGGRCWQYDAALASYVWRASRQVFCYCPISNAWRECNPMLRPRANFACDVAPGSNIVYVAGGVSRTLDEEEDGEEVEDNSEEENDKDEESADERPVVSSHVADSVSYSGFKYRFSDGSAHSTSACHPRNVQAIVDPGVLADCPSAHQVVGSRLLPQRSVRALTSCQLYDPFRDAHAEIASLPGGIEYPDEDTCQGQFLAEEFFVLGRGWGLSAGTRSRPKPGSSLAKDGNVFIYSPQSNTWREGGSGLGPDFRRGYGTAVLGSQLVAFGGLSRLSPSWTAGGRLTVSQNPPGIHAGLDAFCPQNCRPLDCIASSKQAEGSGSDFAPSWRQLSVASFPIPKLMPSCVEVSNSLFVIGSQERKMGVWEVAGLWRAPQPVWVFTPVVREGYSCATDGDGGGTWSQVRPMPYAPVRPKALALWF